MAGALSGPNGVACWHVGGTPRTLERHTTPTARAVRERACHSWRPEAACRRPRSAKLFGCQVGGWLGEPGTRMPSLLLALFPANCWVPKLLQMGVSADWCWCVADWCWCVLNRLKRTVGAVAVAVLTGRTIYKASLRPAEIQPKTRK